MRGGHKIIELLSQLIESKHDLVDKLNEKGEEVSVADPFDDLLEKAGEYVPKTMTFIDEDGVEVTGVLVGEEIKFDAVENDVREGKRFASGKGAAVGTKIIPAYHTSEGYRVIPSGSPFETSAFNARDDLKLYDFTKLQVIICPWAGSLAASVAAEKVAINDGIYAVGSDERIATAAPNGATKKISLGITNDTGIPYIMRYFTYKEVN